jgi:hypothetical protein
VVAAEEAVAIQRRQDETMGLKADSRDVNVGSKADFGAVLEVKRQVDGAGEAAAPAGISRPFWGFKLQLRRSKNN